MVTTHGLVKYNLASSTVSCRPVTAFLAGHKAKSTGCMEAIGRLGWDLSPSAALTFTKSSIPRSAAASLQTLEATFWLVAAALSSPALLRDGNGMMVPDAKQVNDRCTSAVIFAVHALGKQPDLEPFLLMERALRSVLVREGLCMGDAM